MQGSVFPWLFGTSNVSESEERRTLASGFVGISLGAYPMRGRSPCALCPPSPRRDTYAPTLPRLRKAGRLIELSFFF